MMKQLMQRNDAHAIRDTVRWYALVLGAGALFVHGWSAWAVFAAYFFHTTLYCRPADSRWHGSSHGTAFKTRWTSA